MVVPKLHRVGLLPPLESPLVVVPILLSALGVPPGLSLVPLNNAPPQHSIGTEAPNGTEHSPLPMAQHLVMPGRRLEALHPLPLTKPRTGATALELTTKCELTLQTRTSAGADRDRMVDPHPATVLLHPFRHKFPMATPFPPRVPNLPTTPLSIRLPALDTER